MLQETIRHFAELRYPLNCFRVIPVTTSNEIETLGVTSTQEMAQHVAREVNENSGVNLVRPIHVPYRTDCMADQINYAARYLFEAFDEGVDPDNVYVAIYNADSRPELGTLQAASELILMNGATLLQQPSCYVLSARVGQIGKMRQALLWAAGLWQTRWSCSVEFPRWSAGSEGRDGSNFLAFRYLVGHGLFVRLREFIESNYLPRSYNEDAAYGAVHVLAGTRIAVVPCMDIADVPVGVRDLLVQQGQWILGPMQISRHVAMARRIYPSSDPGARLRLMIGGWRDVVAWIGAPAVVFGVVAEIALGDPFLRALATLSLILYFGLPSLMARACIPLAQRPSWTWTAAAILIMPLFHFLHGLGGAIGVVAVCLGLRRPRFVAWKTRRTRQEGRPRGLGTLP